MYGRIIKTLIICLVLIGLGISVKPVLKRTTFSCNAADVKSDGSAPDAGIRPATPPDNPSAPKDHVSDEALPETDDTTAPAPAAGKYDFSDSSHWNLTVSAWESLAQKDYEGVSAYANKCLELYEPKAKEMALGMKSFSRPGHEDDFALVNDVATSHYIMGEAYMKLGRTDDALKEFDYIIVNYPYSLCWDPKGWFWKVAEVSGKNMEKIGKSGPRQAPGDSK